MKRLSFGVVTVVSAVAVGSFALARQDRNPAGMPEVKVLSAVDVAEKVDGAKARATTFEVTFAPGVGGAPHRHPGPIFGYVLEGQFEFAVERDAVRTLKAGATFYEPAMALHRVSRNPSDKTTTRVLAVLVHPRDAEQLVIPEPEN